MASRLAGVYQDNAISFRDAGNEIGTMGFSSTVITVDNIDAQIALWDTFLAAVNTLTLGEITKTVFNTTTIYATTQPQNGAAREFKLLVQYQNTATGKIHTLTIPTLNPVLVTYVQNINVKDAVSLDTPAAITGFIAAFNALVKDPLIPLAYVATIAPAVTVVGLKAVGRNS